MDRAYKTGNKLHTGKSNNSGGTVTRKQVKDLTAAEFKMWLAMNGACTLGKKSVRRLLVFHCTPKQAWDSCSWPPYMEWALYRLRVDMSAVSDCSTCDLLRAKIPFPGEVYVNV